MAYRPYLRFPAAAIGNAPATLPTDPERASRSRSTATKRLQAGAPGTKRLPDRFGDAESRQRVNDAGGTRDGSRKLWRIKAAGAKTLGLQKRIVKNIQ